MIKNGFMFFIIFYLINFNFILIHIFSKTTKILRDKAADLNIKLNKGKYINKELNIYKDEKGIFRCEFTGNNYLKEKIYSFMLEKENVFCSYKPNLLLENIAEIIDINFENIFKLNSNDSLYDKTMKIVINLKKDLLFAYTISYYYSSINKDNVIDINDKYNINFKIKEILDNAPVSYPINIFEFDQSDFEILINNTDNPINIEKFKNDILQLINIVEDNFKNDNKYLDLIKTDDIKYYLTMIWNSATKISTK
jgi:hypothetical protein